MKVLLKWTQIALFAGAIAMLSWCAFAIVDTWTFQREQRRQFASMLADRAMATPPPASDRNVIGLLDIPRLGLSVMVIEGAGTATLRRAAGHIPGTALPGQQGNVGIAGHRDSLFRGLKNIAANDEITFETHDANYVYRVESTQIVKPENVGVLKPGPASELTLVTCYPFEYVGSAPDRFIVKARLVSQLAPQLAQNDIPREAAANDVHDHVEQPVPPVHHEIGFNVSEQHSRELVPGKIWFGLSSADPTGHTVNGWLWVMPDRRTIWLRDVDARQPLVFYQDGEKRELVITSVARTSVTGYLAANPVVARAASRGGASRPPASD